MRPVLETTAVVAPTQVTVRETTTPAETESNCSGSAGHHSRLLCCMCIFMRQRLAGDHIVRIRKTGRSNPAYKSVEMQSLSVLLGGSIPLL
ncbi:MAG: hypothetical protein J07HX5_00589 [halophilic archaeon J07HX5]|nr:MAG: hypothetical protein J07HX5_00589 [halophilic archaeon J07HX5]